MISQIPCICILSGFFNFYPVYYSNYFKQNIRTSYYIISTSVSVIISWKNDILLNHKVAHLKIQIFITPVNFCKYINIRRIVTLQMRNERFYVGKGTSRESTRTFFLYRMSVRCSTVSTVFRRLYFLLESARNINFSGLAYLLT